MAVTRGIDSEIGWMERRERQDRRDGMSEAKEMKG